ncbi:MAG: DUF47 domain-containing protein [Candidatus Odinarchaeia archaeon]
MWAKKDPKAVDEISNLMQELTNKVYECIKATLNAHRDFCYKELDKLEYHVKQAIRRENDADETKNLIQKNLIKSGLIRFIGEDRYNLVEEIDRIADFAEMAARWITLTKIDLSDELIKLLLEVIELTEYTTVQLRTCIIRLWSDFNDAYEGAKKVKLLREEVKEKAFRFLRKMFEEKLKMKDIFFMKETVSNLVNIAEAAEEVAHLISVIVIKYGHLT